MSGSLEARRGDRILPKWRALQRWLRSQRVQAPGAQITYGPGGAQVIFTPPEYGQTVRFRVRIVSTEPPRITVGDGTINGKVPKVDGIPITGQPNPPLPPPEIALVSPDEDGVCMVCIKTTHAANGDMTAATIESKKPADIPGGLRADFISGTHGFIPIALVRHDLQTRKPSSVHQHSVHNLQCRMYQADTGRRVIYWAA